MRAIMLMFDTLSKDFLSNYGNDWIQTPNFDRLREKTVTFDNFYGEVCLVCQHVVNFIQEDITLCIACGAIGAF